MMKLVIVLAACLVFGANADSRSFGKCPHVDAQQKFEMHKMLGTWYVIQKTSTNVPCLTYNISAKEDHFDHYLIGSRSTRNRDLCAKDESNPAVMDLEVPLEIGTYKFTVFMTDYENYAGVFSCKNYPLTFSTINKWSAAILSRKPTLDIEFVEKVRSRLSAYNIDPFSLSIIDQHHCKPGEKGIIIQTASNAVNKVSQTVNNFNTDVVKPVVHEAVDSMKTFIENETSGGKKPVVNENKNAFSSAVDQVNGGGLNTLFEHSDLAGTFEEPSTTKPKPSYLSP
ncbi:hypothetical protein FQR65_LT12575 [Abscondita terminalis]|nr:hypothetical protein FQR65_LT12575 [Abscondita terminalis]